MGLPIPVEDLCEKCRKLPWGIYRKTTRPIYCPLTPLDHHKSLGELGNSAKTGCRTCQIFWLYTIAETNAKVDDDFELEFACQSKYLEIQITIEDSSQSFTREERERMAENMNIKRSLVTGGSQTRGDFGDEISMPSPKITTGEGSTMNKKFMARISAYFRYRNRYTLAEMDFIPYDDSEYIMPSIIKPWVDDCVKNHHGCREVQQLGFEACAPTRLIDVGPTDEDTVKLVDTGDLSKPRYLILSYCWGASNDKSKTTQANIEQRRVSIQIAALPKTIRDAISVTRHLGVQYLWVDAMCIIQKDTENNDGFLDDWKIEAAKMASYYSNALCCISNLSATDSSEGFLQEEQVGFRQGGRPKIFRYHRKGEVERFQHGDQEFTIHLPRSIESWHTEWETSPLMRRAWALQEWILSRRILHCTKVGMFMECGGGVGQTNDPFPKPVAALHRLRGNELSSILREPAQAQIGDLWIKLVTFYSTMNLTDPSDRLVAIDGIARLLCAKYNVGYFAGVLSSHVAQTLLWRPKKLKHEVNSAVSFPSWSWSSTMNVEFPEFDTCTSYVTCIDDGCFLLSDKVVNYADPSTRLFPLRGPILPISTVCDPSKLSSNGGGFSCCCNGPLWGGKPIYFYTDSTKERTKLKQCVTDKEKAKILGRWKFLVCLRGFTKFSPVFLHAYKIIYHGLIVEKLKDTGTNGYQRIGWFDVIVEDGDEQPLNLEEWMTNIKLF